MSFLFQGELRKWKLCSKSSHDTVKKLADMYKNLSSDLEKTEDLLADLKEDDIQSALDDCTLEEHGIDRNPPPCPKVVQSVFNITIINCLFSSIFVSYKDR